MLEKAELTLIIMLSKTKKVITTHLIVLCSVASRKLFYSIAWRVGTLSLQFVPPAEGGGMEIIMKKIMAVMLSLLACTVLLAGCNTSSESNEEQSLKVYSFSGENEYISVSNGVIILDGKDEICYGGDLKVMSDDFANITTYSTTIYINGSEKETLLSNGVDDQTGGTIDVSGNIGKISGDILRDSDADKLTDNLWFELKTTNLSGEENTYQVQLETTEITKAVKK